MSTVTVKNGIMAADGLNATMGYIDKKPIERIYRLQIKKFSEPDEEGFAEHEATNSVYVGVVGNIHDCHSFIAWYINSHNPMDFRAYFDQEQINFAAIVYEKESNTYTKYNNGPLAYPCGSETAIGTGASYALGAMQMGAEAVDAILAVSQLDLFTNNKVHYINMMDGSTDIMYVN